MRKGMATGQGKGYRNIVGRDSGVHRDSAHGMKQPQKINTFTNIPKHTEALKDYDEYLKKVKDKRTKKKTISPFKVGDKVKYKEDDGETYTVLGIYPNNQVSLSLADYDDTEQDDTTDIKDIVKIKR